MNQPTVVSEREWLTARKALLAEEKALIRQRDRVNAARRALPMAAIDKPYRFTGPHGEVGLADMFDGRRQLIVYHFMFDPDWDEGCSHCAFLVDNMGDLSHLHARDTTLVLVSRAPLAKLEHFRERMGWTLPWYSSHGSDFNYDFHVTADETVMPVEYNFSDKAELERTGQGVHASGEQPGLSVFMRDGTGRVCRTYAAFSRGLDMLMTTYNYLDLTPQGRGEGWDGMPDLTGEGMMWVRYHDRYPETGSGRTHISAQRPCCG
jgi:predicted dithiol-disulfide oxidoreductase (DUF899 family)